MHLILEIRARLRSRLHSTLQAPLRSTITALTRGDRFLAVHATRKAKSNGASRDGEESVLDRRRRLLVGLVRGSSSWIHRELIVLSSRVSPTATTSWSLDSVRRRRQMALTYVYRGPSRLCLSVHTP
ncbi:hypothetical protein DTO027B5_4501 [Paecilomyces variotii]|nr:hypothetical protein DTO027B3_5432 [Paecilomyces variotii]KAJ9333721.1 hypothetical protein DTO027B5_4501 [Paecilomyces variotii]